LPRLVERHLEELPRVWPRRLTRRHRPLRPVVEQEFPLAQPTGLSENLLNHLAMSHGVE
jgi:hypothetical protein